MFAGALQVIVELSTWVQWFLSLPVFIWLFPHIMTICLIHGFVFWSLGTWLCVTLGVMGLPYWANMLIVVVVCYAVLVLVSALLTLLTEKPAQAVYRNTWRWASQQPIVKLSTLFPYPKDQFLGRTKDDRGDSKDREDNPEEKLQDKDAYKPDDKKMEEERDRSLDIMRMRAGDVVREGSLQQEHSDTDQTPRWDTVPPMRLPSTQASHLTTFKTACLGWHCQNIWTSTNINVGGTMTFTTKVLCVNVHFRCTGRY